MGNFIWPEWMPQPQATPPPSAPPPDPMVAREEKIANDTRVEQALNQFLAAKQGALFDAPDAFYRTQGEDAIHAAPVATKNLNQLRNTLLDGLANDYQRNRLSNALDAQMQLTRDGMARHVAEQSLAWQRGVAQDRIALLAKEAARHHNDTDLVDALGHAAATAARAHSRVGDGPPGGEAEDAAAATARSGVLGAAIQARLDRGDIQGANALLTQVQDQLDPAHAAPLQGQIDTLQRLGAAKDYVRKLVPAWSDISHDEVDAQHAAATQLNQTDNADDPELQADVQHVLDVQHGRQKRGLDQAAAPHPNQALQDWLSQAGPGGQPQTERPPAAIWSTLGPDERAAVDRQLSANARGETSEALPPGQARLFVVPGSIAATIEGRPQPPVQEPPAQQPPDEGPNPPQNGGLNDTDPGLLPEDQPSSASPEDETSLGGEEIPPSEVPPRQGGISASTIAVPGAGAPPLGEAATAAAKELGRVIARVAPYAGRVASAGGAAATVLLVPGNTPATTIELGDGLRIRKAPGQRTVTIERQVDKGLFGTGLGAKWEELPVDAEHATAPDGRSIIVINPRQLERAIGADAMDRIVRPAGIAMARPPRDGDEEDRPPPGIGHNSGNVPGPGNRQRPPSIAVPLGTSTDEESEDRKLRRWATKNGLKYDSPTTKQIIGNLDMSVDQYISRFRLGSIRSEFPNDMLSGSVRDALESGNSKIRKLLVDGRYAK